MQSSFDVKLEKRVCASLLGCFSGWSLKGVVFPVFLQQLMTAASLLLIPTPPEDGHLIGHRAVVIDWLVVSVAILFCSLNSVLSREREAGL